MCTNERFVYVAYMPIKTLDQSGQSMSKSVFLYYLHHIIVGVIILVLCVVHPTTKQCRSFMYKQRTVNSMLCAIYSSR